MASSSQPRPPSGHYEVSVLGPCIVRANGAALDVTRWPRKAASLLRLLAVVREHRLSRDEAVELLWPDVAPDAGVSNLKSIVHRLRRQLDEHGTPSPIVLQSGWVLLNPSCTFDVDAARFEELIQRVRTAGDETLALLEEVANLYRGEALVEDRYEDWSLPIREHLQRLWRDAVLQLVRLHRQGGETGRALDGVAQLVAADPLDEEAVAEQLRMLMAIGRRAEAVRTLRALEGRLRRELGVGATAATRAILARPGNLPAATTSFVGRAEDLAVIVSLLQRPDVRLVTLTGPGGVGKTRLACEAAGTDVDAFVDGAYVVALASIDDGALVLPAVARALDVHTAADRPLEDALTAAIGHRDLLLILDNCEHLIEATPVVSRLLGACPSLRVLATSRTPLHLSGEHVYPISPLPLADPEATHEALAGSEPVRLFLERARAVRPQLDGSPDTVRTAAEICRLVDGLPLAIELAAARVGAMSLPGLRTGLHRRLDVLRGGPRDVPERQRTIRGTIAWSYALLPPNEQRLLARLAVFVGGCTLEAAVAVCAPDAEPVDRARRGLAHLVESSLLQQTNEDEPRYSMLETVREFAAEQLAASGEAMATERRHAEYLRDLTQGAEPEMEGPRQRDWIERFEAEHDNIRAALRWCLDHGEAELGIRLIVPTWHFWAQRGHFTEGRRWLEALLALDVAIDPLTRALALDAAGGLALFQGDPARAQEQLEEARSLYEIADERTRLANLLSTLGLAVAERGDPRSGQECLERSLALHRDMGDKRNIAKVLNNLAYVLRAQGRQEGLRAMSEEGLRLMREVGDMVGIAHSLNEAAGVAASEGDSAQALQLHEEALALLRQQGDKRSAADTLHDMGVLAEQNGDMARARAHYRESLDLWVGIGSGRGVAGCLEGLARVAMEEGAYRHAARLFAAAESLREAMPAPARAVNRKRNEPAQAQLRTHLSATELAATRERGRAMSLEDAAAYAMGFENLTPREAAGSTV